MDNYNFYTALIMLALEHLIQKVAGTTGSETSINGEITIISKCKIENETI